MEFNFHRRKSLSSSCHHGSGTFVISISAQPRPHEFGISCTLSFCKRRQSFRKKQSYCNSYRWSVLTLSQVNFSITFQITSTILYATSFFFTHMTLQINGQDDEPRSMLPIVDGLFIFHAFICSVRFARFFRRSTSLMYQQSHWTFLCRGSQLRNYAGIATDVCNIRNVRLCMSGVG